MLKKKNIFTSLVAIVLGLTVFSSSTFATTLVVDNDALSSAPGSNFMEGSWTYKTGSGLNGDYRITSSSTIANKGYGWMFDVTMKTTSHYVYLNNASFTNPKVAYQVDYNSGLVYINQNTAPGGWNFLKKSNSYGNEAAIYINSYYSSKQGYTGIDAAKVTY